MRKSKVKLPETYKGHLDQLEVTVYNADDVVLEHNLGIIRATYIQIRLPEYKAYEKLGGSLTVSFEFVTSASADEPEITEAEEKAE